MLVVSPVAVIAAGGCTPWAAKLASLQGRVEVKSGDSQVWEPGVLDVTYCPGDSIRVGANSRAAVVLPNETLLRLDQNTVITLTAVEPEAESLLELFSGIVNFISRVPRSLKINTPYVNASIEGTEFVVSVKEKQADITVFEGIVLAQNPQGELRLTSGESTTAIEGQAPIKVTVVRPRDAVQWALYYPPIIDPYRPDAAIEGAAEGAVRASLKLFSQGDVPGALTRLDEVLIGFRDSGYYSYRTSMLLYVGRVNEAEADINQALAQNPTDANAMTLQSIIALVRNDVESALQLATDATKTQPDLAAPHIALSYARQARFDLERALVSAQKATELEPDNALVRARVAELQLAHGRTQYAVSAAEKAADLSPKLARTQWILGFVYLSQIRVKQAIPAFERAIALDTADPMARLGLGLAKIRQNNIKEGRRDIEISATLDPNSSIIRSYLGKAYYEEKRSELALEQYDMAKGLDPKDPTPWFYDAILKQSVNRPVEALHEIERSNELNDNRAEVRATRLRFQDEAARNASQARIYNNLGFQQRGLLEGWKSVNTDPGNHSGHRLLADTYAALPRHEIARVSELLQSQLLQPLNTNPIQPQIAEANLGILSGSGPSSPSSTEFNPMFTRNGIGGQFDGVFGGNSTLGNNLIISGLHDRVSYSLGQFHYETDGFRENNDLTQNIYNAFIQGSLSQSTSIQAEYRYRDADHGDLMFMFDPDLFSPVERSERRRNTGRLGLNHRFSPNGQLLASVIYQDSHIERNETLIEQNEIPPMTYELTDIDTIDSEGYTAELQYLGNAWAVNYVAGAGRFDEDRHDTEFVNEIFTAPLLLPEPDVNTDFNSLDINTRYNNAYIYTYPKLSEEITLTLGVSFDDLESSDIARDELNPKLGVMWKGAHGTTVRAAYFEGITRPLNAEQTIEPTQVVGFNQFFDDLAGSDTKRYGIALEQRFNPNVFSGIELTWRDIEAVGITTFKLERFTLLDDRKEQFHRAYVYWTPTRQLAFSTEYFYEEEDGERLIPFKLVTQRAPIGLSYFWPAGGFINGMATYVNQEFTGPDGTADDQFWIADLAIGYRLPRRRGNLQLVVKNMLDEQFNYFDPSFRALAREPRGPIFAPETQVLVQFNLSFR